VRRLDPDRLVVHVDRLYRAAWALCGNREEAEDLVQECYARVLAKPRVLRGESELAYLLRVLRNTFVSGLRTRERRPRAEASLADRELADRSSARRPEAALETRAVFAAIAALPEHFRDALVAVDVAGFSYAEAGRLLAIEEATVATRLHRARKQVVAQLTPAAAESSGAGAAS
jgi:RNA polymerase sigma-70 factor, ECF subfamily